MKSKEMDMTTGNLAKKIIIFALPVMLSSIIQLLFNACDLVVIGQFSGDNSLAAVGSTGALINLIINMFIGVSVGANVICARAIGNKDIEKAQRCVHTAITFSFIAGIILTIFGIIAARECLILMDTKDECLDKATLYVQIYFGGMIFNMLYNFGSAILRSVGETRKPLYFITAAGIINAGLNLLFVIVFKMDVAGVALATIISQAISAVLVFICLTRKTGYVNLNIKKLRIHGLELKEMIFNGLPAGIQGSLFSISNVFIQKAVNSFNITAIVSGNTASSNVEGFIYQSMNSFYQACISFTSQNFGAKNKKNCKKVLIYCQIFAVLTGVILGGIVLIFKDQFLGFYTSNQEAINYGVQRIVIICTTYYLCGIMDVFVGGMRGLGYSVVPMIVSIMGACVFRIVWIHTIFAANHTLFILYISYPISWLLTSLIHFISYIIVYRKIKFEPDNSNMSIAIATHNNSAC